MDEKIQRCLMLEAARKNAATNFYAAKSPRDIFYWRTMMEAYFKLVAEAHADLCETPKETV